MKHRAGFRRQSRPGPPSSPSSRPGHLVLGMRHLVGRRRGHLARLHALQVRFPGNSPPITRSLLLLNSEGPFAVLGADHGSTLLPGAGSCTDFLRPLQQIPRPWRLRTYLVLVPFWRSQAQSRFLGRTSEARGESLCLPVSAGTLPHLPQVNHSSDSSRRGSDLPVLGPSWPPPRNGLMHYVVVGSRIL